MSRMYDAGWPRQIELGHNHRTPDLASLHPAMPRELARRGGWTLCQSWTGAYLMVSPTRDYTIVDARDEGEARTAWRREMDRRGVVA